MRILQSGVSTGGQTRDNPLRLECCSPSYCLNEGTVLTFIRGDSSSRLTSPLVQKDLKGNSNHGESSIQRLLATISALRSNCPSGKGGNWPVSQAKGWQIDRYGYDRRRDSLHRKLKESVIETPLSLSEVISSAFSESSDERFLWKTETCLLVDPTYNRSDEN